MFALREAAFPPHPNSRCTWPNLFALFEESLVFGGEEITLTFVRRQPSLDNRSVFPAVPRLQTATIFQLLSIPIITGRWNHGSA